MLDGEEAREVGALFRERAQELLTMRLLGVGVFQDDDEDVPGAPNGLRHGRGQ